MPVLFKLLSVLLTARPLCGEQAWHAGALLSIKRDVLYFNIPLSLCLEVLTEEKQKAYGSLTPTAKFTPVRHSYPPEGGEYLFSQVVGSIVVEFPHVMPSHNVFTNLKVMGQVHG